MSQAMTAPSNAHPSRAPAARVTPSGVGRRARPYPVFKVCVEWLGALVMLVAAAPLMVCLAGVLKCTSEGPVLYSQIRLGRGGRPFRMYKLRTMTHGCEAETGPVWSVEDDPRVTKIGRRLRETHLDEVPQLWNVLRGEMSLIGPRPERPEIAAVIEQVLPEFRSRLRVRPGITGLAQMQRPADSDLHAVRHKLAADLVYVDNLGLMLDARIALATIFHSAGHLATAASRRIVRPFTPRARADAAVMEPDFTLSMAGRRTGERRTAPNEELSRAA